MKVLGGISSIDVRNAKDRHQIAKGLKNRLLEFCDLRLERLQFSKEIRIVNVVKELMETEVFVSMGELEGMVGN